jgi:hypothetical protein
LILKAWCLYLPRYLQDLLTKHEDTVSEFLNSHYEQVS